MRAHLLALALLVASIPTTGSQSTAQAPTAGPAADDLAVPSWVAVEPPCEGDGEPEAAQPAATVSSGGAAASAEVVVEPAGTDDRLAFDYDSTAGTVEFDYRSADGGSRRMRIDFDWLHEFVDDDGDGVLDEGEALLRSVQVASPLLHYARAWEEPCGVRLQWMYLLTVTADDLAGMDDQEQAEFLEDKPRLVLRFTHMAAAGSGFSPDRVKIDIGIDDYDHAHAASLLAFSTVVDGAWDRSEDALVSSSEGSTIGYTWLPTAVADGQVVPVAASVTQGDGASTVTFVYPHARSILHDPELGLVGLVRALLDRASLDPAALGTGMVVGTAFLLLTAFVRRRWP